MFDARVGKKHESARHCSLRKKEGEKEQQEHKRPRQNENSKRGAGEGENSVKGVKTVSMW